MNAPSNLVWADDGYSVHRIEAAIAESKSAILRVQGMKVRARLNPPVQIDLGARFPYPHRTCAEWI